MVRRSTDAGDDAARTARRSTDVGDGAARAGGDGAGAARTSGAVGGGDSVRTSGAARAGGGDGAAQAGGAARVNANASRDANRNNGDHDISIPMRSLYIVLLFVVLCVAFVGGYLLVSALALLVGPLPPLVSHLVSPILGIALFAGIILLIRQLNSRFRSDAHVHVDFVDEITNALSRIAAGDFSVRIKQDRHHPMADLIESVNRMADNLDTMEVQRQEFISNVSHEIQSPLTSISGFANLLRSENLDPANRSHYLSIIEAESKRLSRLSENLLKLTSLEDDTALVPTLVDLSAQLEHVLLMLEPQWEAKHLTVELRQNAIMLVADEELLEQVWVNLIHNAIKFTPEGGAITVTIALSRDEASAKDTASFANEPDDTDTADNADNADTADTADTTNNADTADTTDTTDNAENANKADKNERHVLVAVTDTGMGIPPADLPHIFERFYKADKSRDRSFGGNGLGLALAKRIIELHGGAIEATSTPGHGTSFMVKLPL